MSIPKESEDLLAGSWAIDGDEELVTLTDEMFVRSDDSPEAEARTLSGLAAMHEEDKLYKARLADLRRATGLTQADVANHMGVSQSGVAAIESPTDIRISTLARYLEAIGGHAELNVTFDDHTHMTINLKQLVPPLTKAA
jgi:DNA-binding XRE family transcriptional regulator